MSGQSSSHTKGVKTLENLYTINLYFYGQTLQVGLCGKRIKKKSLVAVFVAVDCLVGSFDLYFIEKSVDVCICRLSFFFLIFSNNPKREKALLTFYIF